MAQVVPFNNDAIEEAYVEEHGLQDPRYMLTTQQKLRFNDTYTQAANDLMDDGMRLFAAQFRLSVARWETKHPHWFAVPVHARQYYRLVNHFWTHNNVLLKVRALNCMWKEEAKTLPMEIMIEVGSYLISASRSIQSQRIAMSSSFKWPRPYAMRGHHRALHDTRPRIQVAGDNWAEGRVCTTQEALDNGICLTCGTLYETCPCNSDQADVETDIETDIETDDEEGHELEGQWL